MMTRTRATLAGLVAVSMTLGCMPAAAAEDTEFRMPSLDQLSSGIRAGASAAVGNDPDSPENQAAQEQRWRDHRRRRTILHYGVTTQADVEACQEEWKGKPIVAKDFGYDYPCPLAPITDEDVASARREDTLQGILMAPIMVAGFLLAVLRLPIDWVWNGLRGERDKFSS
ncbi:hypothetical protein C1Y63_05870 [Corynebacterium sp. 13CS0277]|uniref:hypothetical protein n=1 Tax=Corynebacterium sp. 13CS0277 TaxID=2071994 RepID=UPI000D02EE13|nr:hypothetical protein [Corynebacterium sp. 13CS0277]PRQ11528.1 hypothetical protein C1Y63_05870 [Corynebacterium sp. 13CS0277]